MSAVTPAPRVLYRGPNGTVEELNSEELFAELARSENELARARSQIEELSRDLAMAEMRIEQLKP